MKDSLELVLSQINVMRQQENSASYKCSDYLSRSQVIKPSHREILCKWGYQSIAACKDVSSSTAVVALTYFDRFLSSDSPAAQRALNDVQECQLAYLTSLIIALKKINPEFNVESYFITKVVTKSAYRADEINSMKLEILQSLNWELNGPTSLDFVDYYLEVMPGVDGTRLERIQNLSKTLVKLAVRRYSTVMHLPSEIAFASVFCATYRLELALLADNLTHLQMISGLELSDVKLGSLFQTMICLARECFLDWKASALGRDM
eukprot:scaffold1350_cov56-Cyclotella_meneghiniana.AAC.7